MSRRRSSQANNFFNPTLSRGITAIIFVIAAILVTLSFFGKIGTLGIILNDWLFSFLFGSMRYAVPPILLTLAWLLIKTTENNYRPIHGLGAFLFFLATSGLLHLGWETEDMWRLALEGEGGGIFGMIAWPLRAYTGYAGGITILLGLIAISLLLLASNSFFRVISLYERAISAISQTLRAIFVKNKTKDEPIKIQNNYEKENAKDDGEDESMVKRFFSAKKLTDDEEETEGETKETLSSETPTELTGPWAKKVVVKDTPPLSLLSDKKTKPTSGDIEVNAQIIKKTLHEFGIVVDMGDIRVGPTVTQYSLKPASGVKLSKITTLSNDLSLALAAHPIRIEAPIPGKSLVGIEVPNQKTAMVTFKELLESNEFRTRAHNMMIALGKDVAGKVWFADLPRMPHLLIAGATGSGKTVCVNTIIMSLLYQNTAETLRFIMVDPKRVELTLYNGIPHLLAPVVTNTQKTVNALKWTIGEMERRFEVFSQAGSRDLASYNKKKPQAKLPHIVFIIDELADLMATAAGEVEAGIIRLAQMARAVGIHLILATQRPSVDVITGLMKANIPARIAFSVASLVDSRTILDSSGAEKLLGRGDMLFQTAELSKPVRLQGSFISEDELSGVVNYLKGGEKVEYDESILGKQSTGMSNLFAGADEDQDPLFDDAKRAIMEAGKASASFLQRKLKVGYARAARLLDELENAGIIGPGDGAKPRDVLVKKGEDDIIGSSPTIFKQDNISEFTEPEQTSSETANEEQDEDDEEIKDDKEDTDKNLSLGSV